MKLIKFIDDLWKDTYFYQEAKRRKEGMTIEVDNWRARCYCKEVIDWEDFFSTGKKKIIKIGAIVIKDLGLHFGNSKHIYLMNGRSKIYNRRKML